MAEKRLIDANALLAIYEKWIPQLSSPEDDGDRRGVETCIVVLKDASTVDAVEVVRCRDCLYWDNITHFCHQHSQYYDGGRSWDTFKEDDFCSYGERRE